MWEGWGKMALGKKWYLSWDSGMGMSWMRREESLSHTKEVHKQRQENMPQSQVREGP